jgi:hypothetical protein
MSDVSKIPPKSEWRTLSVYQLLDIKSQMTETYYRLRAAGASFAAQYLAFVNELESLIRSKEAAEIIEKEKEAQS